MVLLAMTVESKGILMVKRILEIGVSKMGIKNRIPDKRKKRI
jgi:hypothetical protein